MLRHTSPQKSPCLQGADILAGKADNKQMIVLCQVMNNATEKSKPG